MRGLQRALEPIAGGLLRGVISSLRFPCGSSAQGIEEVLLRQRPVLQILVPCVGAAHAVGDQDRGGGGTAGVNQGTKASVGCGQRQHLGVVRDPVDDESWFDHVLDPLGAWPGEGATVPASGGRRLGPPEVRSPPGWHARSVTVCRPKSRR